MKKTLVKVQLIQKVHRKHLEKKRLKKNAVVACETDAFRVDPTPPLLFFILQMYCVRLEYHAADQVKGCRPFRMRYPQKQVISVMWGSQSGKGREKKKARWIIDWYYYCTFCWQVVKGPLIMMMVWFMTMLICNDDNGGDYAGGWRRWHKGTGTGPVAVCHRIANEMKWKGCEIGYRRCSWGLYKVVGKSSCKKLYGNDEEVE